MTKPGRRTRWPQLAAAAIVAASALPAQPARAEEIRDANFGFTLTLPDGFGDYPPGRAQPKTIYSYVNGLPGSDNFAIVSIQPLGGTIGREPLDPLGLPHVDGVQFSVRPEKWKSFDIDVMVGVARQQDASILVQIAQVPLKREAIQLAVSGPEAHQAELTALLRTLLGSLDGESNWLSNSERAYRGGKAAVGVVALALVGWWAWRQRKRSRSSRRSSAGG